MDDYFFYSVMTTIGGILLYLVIHIVVRAPGSSLQYKFRKLGTVTGKSSNDIISVVGKPNSISSVGNGQKLYQWISTGYHVSLLFDKDDKCLGVSSETSV